MKILKQPMKYDKQLLYDSKVPTCIHDMYCIAIAEYTECNKI